MKGLEISVLKLNVVKKGNEDLFRLEAEFFKKEYLLLEDKFKDAPTIESLDANITCGPFGSNLLDTLYIDQGVLVVRPFNLKNCKVENENLVYISEFDIKNNKLKTFNKGTLLFSRVGDIKTGILDKTNATISPNIIAVEFSDEILSKFLSVFFKTNYGYKQILRQLKISAQPTISTEIISKLKIPIVSRQFMISIAELLDNSFNNENKCEFLYNKVVLDFFEELSILNWEPSYEGKAVKKFSNSFGISGRLDAEYYQPKFDELIEVISNVKNKSLGSIATFRKSIEPGSDAYQLEGLPFIRVSDISKFGISATEIHLDKEIYKDETLKPKKDTILLTKDGSVGIAYKVEQDLDVITSSAILHLIVTNKEVLPDYLTLVLNSKLTQMQAERDAGGSIIQHWRLDEIKQVLIPILPMDIQKELVKHIQQSFKLRQESTKLIDIAKQAVEIAIEQDENTALNFIKKNI